MNPRTEPLPKEQSRAEVLFCRRMGPEVAPACQPMVRDAVGTAENRSGRQRPVLCQYEEITCSFMHRKL
jgi:hypothetical protein